MFSSIACKLCRKMQAGITSFTKFLRFWLKASNSLFFVISYRVEDTIYKKEKNVSVIQQATDRILFYCLFCGVCFLLADEGRYSISKDKTVVRACWMKTFLIQRWSCQKTEVAERRRKRGTRRYIRRVLRDVIATLPLLTPGEGQEKLLYTHNKKIYPKTKTKLYKLLSFLMPTLLKLVLGILKTGSWDHFTDISLTKLVGYDFKTLPSA